MRNLRDEYDVIIVGAGRAGIKALRELYENLHEQLLKSALNKSSNQKEINICIAHDKSKVGGPAYNPDQSPSPLAFHQPVSIIEYAQNDEEKTEFENWLDKHTEDALEYIKSEAANPNNPMQKTNQEWLEKYEAKIETKEYGQIPVPRAIYGMYLQEMLEQTIEDFKNLEKEFGVKVNIDAIHTKIEIQGKNKEDGSFEFAVGDNPKTLALNGKKEESVELSSGKISAKKVIFCPGLMPNPLHRDAKGKPNYFGYNYDDNGSMLSIKNAIEEKWRKKNEGRDSNEQKPVEIIIAGSNASAHEIIWLIHGANLVDKVHIHIISSDPQPRSPSYDKGGKYEVKGDLSKVKTVDGIINFIEEELKSNNIKFENGAWNEDESEFSRSEISNVLWPKVKKYVDSKEFPEKERESFYANCYKTLHYKYGVFEPKEIIDAWNEMLKKEVITYHKGNIFDHDKVFSNGDVVTCEYEDVIKEKGEKIRDQKQPHQISADFFVNCISGSTRLDKNNNENTYYSNLKDKLGVALNSTKTGLCLGEDGQIVAEDGGVIEGFYAIGYPINNSRNPENGSTISFSGAGFIVDSVAKYVAKKISEYLFDKILNKEKFPAKDINPRNTAQLVREQNHLDI